MRSNTFWKKQHITHGFTLIELVIVVLILGILAGIAVPRLLNVGQASAEQAVVTQVHEIFRAAELYYAEHGEWPENAEVGTFPEAFRGILPQSVFTESSPLGMPFDWNGPGTTMPTLGVSIPGFMPLKNRESIDLQFDDGDLNTGWITFTSGGHLNFELAPN